MGNRAVISFSEDHTAPCVYLHWNGGWDSVSGFLKAAQEVGMGDLPTDSEKMDAFAEMCAGCLDTKVGMTVYREIYGEADTDNYDNGVYLLNQDFTLRGRRYHSGPEQRSDNITQQIYTECLKFGKEIMEKRGHSKPDAAPMTQTGQHTPGPWKRQGCRIVSETAFYDWSLGLEEPPVPVSVLELTGSMGGDDTTADARLIAAAPELLEAVLALNLDVSLPPKGHSATVWAPKVRALRAAIAKATGQSDRDVDNWE